MGIPTKAPVCQSIAWPEVIILFHAKKIEHEIYQCHVINVKMATFISMINTISESFKARKVFIFQHFSFYEQLKFYAQLS